MKHSFFLILLASICGATNAQSTIADPAILKLGYIFAGRIKLPEIQRKLLDAQFTDYYIRINLPKTGAELLSVNMPGSPMSPQFLLVTYAVNCEKGALRMTYSQQFDAIWQPKSEKLELKGANWEMPAPGSLAADLRGLACK